jgi:hypothetical protein
VGKKPPQSQKGGSHGLTPRTSAGLSPKEEKKFKFKKKNTIFIFIFIFGFLPRRGRPCGAPRGRLRPTRKKN